MKTYEIIQYHKWKNIPPIMIKNGFTLEEAEYFCMEENKKSRSWKYCKVEEK